MSAKAPDRYHPLRVGLHWLVVLLLFVMFILGKVMSRMPKDAVKLIPLSIYITLGLSIVILLVIRLIVRLRLPQPAPLPAGYFFFALLGRIVHYALYALVFLMAVSGTSISIRTGLLPIIFGTSDAALPPDFVVYPARMLHGMTAIVFVATVILHAGAAVYHQAALRDHIFRRMIFEKKPVAEAQAEQSQHAEA